MEERTLEPTLERGRIVRSMAGHDKNRFYMIVKTENGHVWIADGKVRRLLSPKRKSLRHLGGTKTIFDPAEVTSDKKLRAMLRPFNGAADATEREGS